MLRQSMRHKKPVERFIDIQESLTKGRYHGWNDTWVRGFNGHEGTNAVTTEEIDVDASGYFKDGFIVEDSLSDQENKFDSSDDEYDSTDYDSSDEESDEEEEGIGCNKCYSCVTGGSGPCVLYEEEEEAEFDE